MSAQAYRLGGRQEEAARLEAQAKAIEGLLQKEFSLIGLKPGLKVLDAGCGTGAISRRIAAKVFPGEVHGVDFDQLFLEEARRIADTERVTNVTYHRGNANKLDYGDETFDIAYCRLVLMHVKDPVETVTEMKRVTKKNGLVAVSDNDDGIIVTYPPIPKALGVWAKFGEWARSHGSNRYIGRSLFSTLSKAGLNPVDIFPIPLAATQKDSQTLKMLVSVPLQIIQQSKDALIKENYISEEDYQEGLREVNVFLNDPGAFTLGISFLAIGKVP